MSVAVRRRVVAVRSALLTLGAAAGALSLLATVIAPLVDVRPLIFLSGSMSPTIPAGSLALARTVDAGAIQVGDIVTVPSGGNFVTHRVVDVTHAPGRATMMLRGDGNNVADAAAYDVASAPRTEIWIPYAGSVVAWFSHAPGIYVLAGWVAIVLGTLRRGGSPSQRPERPSRPGRPKLVLTMARLLPLAQNHQRSGARLALTATGVAMVAAAPLVAPAPAMAAWADTVQLSGATVRTATITAPVASCGTGGVSTLTVNWTSVPAATHYELTYGGVGNPTLEVVGANVTTKTFGAGDGGKFNVRARFGSPTWLSGPSNTVSYSAQGQSSCNAAG